MVASGSKPDTKEKTDAQDAKKKADPAKNDPKYMPNIEPQTGESGKKSPAKEVSAPKTDLAGDGISENPVHSPQATNPDSVDVTIEGDKTTVSKGPSGKRSNKGGVVLDPASVALIPGNTVSFVAEDRPDATRIQAKIITSRETWMVATSRDSTNARVSKILEVPGEITVEFYEDGKLYASGTWTVG